MQSFEFKAELRDPEIARFVCKHIGAIEVGTCRSQETYFRVANGRLKRRIADDEPTEWIFYHRVDRTQPKISHFTLYSDQQARERFGEQPIPVWVQFHRTREIWLSDWVRINIDTIDNLGTFLELEAIVSKDRNVAVCHRKFAQLREHFARALGEPLSHSYADLVALEQDIASPEQSTPASTTDMF